MPAWLVWAVVALGLLAAVALVQWAIYWLATLFPAAVP
jgi:hypothetical protein